MKTYQDLVIEARKNVQLVSADKFEKAISNAQILIDVREESEYAQGHIPGAVHMSRGVIEARLSMVPNYQNPETRIVLYCRTDARATLVAASLKNMGYVAVEVLTGGFEAWSQAGRPIKK